MATDALSYTGINRAVSDFAGAKACEELINLRPATEGTVPVKDFSVKLADVPFKRVFVHYTTDGPHYIVIRLVNDGDDAAVQYVEDNGTVKKTLFQTVWYGDQTLDSLHFASAGNVLLISLCDRDNGVYENKAYIWKDDEYVGMEADDPGVEAEIDDNEGELVCVSEHVQDMSDESDAEEVKTAVESAINAAQEKNPGICLGTIIIATALKTNDGNTFWTRTWLTYDPLSAIGTTSPPYMDATTMEPSRAAAYADFFEAHDGHGYLVGAGEAGNSINKLDIYGTKVKLNIHLSGTWNENESIIQSVEVYSSRPALYLDTDDPYEGLKYTIGVLNSNTLILPQKKYGEMDLGGQILYHQASVPMSSLADGDQVVELAFGGNLQVVEDALDADAGALKRYGRILSYNARFHFWDSVAQVTVGNASFSFPESDGSTTTGNVLAKYQDDDGEHLLCIGELENWAYSEDIDDSAYFVIAPSINIKEVVLYAKVGGGYYEQKYRMEASTTYNYSICVGGAYSAMHALSGSVQAYDDAVDRADADGYGAVSVNEPAAINVTEQYNPFVFRVEHSYLAPGNVLDIQPQMAGLADSSYGRDPLTVFTERGTYALTQGSADVLYGAFLPVSNNVISAKGAGASLPTDLGTFYLGDGCLWLIAGRRSTLISDALHLGPHPYVRTCPGYKRISGGGTDTPEYDVSALVSQVTFETFVRTGGRLSFNRFRMELLVSNPLHPYTYVLSLKYRQWFKIGRRVWQDEAGSDLASTPGATPGNINVVDLATEEATAQVLVHMQTRPFSMAYRHIHMHRVVAMVRARLASSAGDKLVVGLYGSDDLRTWRLLAYAKRNGGSGTLDVSQIRTTPSARSWRYYTVCIGGPVQPDTDFGPVLVDYEPVIRRIG